MTLRRSAAGVFRHNISMFNLSIPEAEFLGGKDMAIAFDQVRTMVRCVFFRCDSWLLFDVENYHERNRSRKHHDT